MIHREKYEGARQPGLDIRSIQVELIGVDELAAILKVSSRTVWRLVSSGEAPAPLRIGGSCRWRLKQVQDWIEDNCPPQK